MRLYKFALPLVAVGCSSASSGGDGGTGNPSSSGSGNSDQDQHVVACTGTVDTSQPSYCPSGDCDEAGGRGDVVKCTAYTGILPGSTDGVCNPGETGSYGLQFGNASNPQDTSNILFEVVACSGGNATLHVCVHGFGTDPNGYDGMPGYKCVD